MRKAVISSALMKARGVPARSSSVRDPFGVVLCELAIDSGGMLVDVFVEEFVEDCSERERESREMWEGATDGVFRAWKWYD